ncbi:MAG: NTP transferase domain-containing protein [Burkholderiaceae bacterium]
MSDDSPVSSPRVGAVLLGAGRASRMGGPNKLLLSVDGEPMIARAARALARFAPDDWVVVLGRDADEVEAAVAQALAGSGAEAARRQPPLPPPPPRWCRVAAGLEQPASVVAGLHALSPALDAVLIMLGDQPLLDDEDLRWLLAQWRRLPPGSALVPCRGAQRGNPVVFDAALRDAMLAAASVRGFLDAQPQRVHRVEAPNDHFVFDVDTPADLQRLAGLGYRVRGGPGG